MLTGVPVYEGPPDADAGKSRHVTAAGPSTIAACSCWRRPARTPSITAGVAAPSRHRRRDLRRSSTTLLRELGAAPPRILIPEEALSPTRTTAARATLLGEQPPWSDLPVLVLTRAGADSAGLARSGADAGQRHAARAPAAGATLLSAVRTALRARERQYQIRGHLAERGARRRGAARGRPAQGRVPRHARPRAAQSAGAAADRPAAAPGVGAATTHVVADVSAVMERQVSHLVRLVDDLLEVSRITRGADRDRSASRSICVHVLRSAIETSRPAVDAARPRADVELPAEPIAVAGDAVRLTQVFANLLTNAAKYTDAGGDDLAHARDSDGGRAIVSVRDNGIGIPTGASAHRCSTCSCRWTARTAARRAGSASA